MNKQKDWRIDYIICPHVEKNSKNLRHQEFRVCCQSCYEEGYLWADYTIFKKIPHKYLCVRELPLNYMVK